MSLRVLVVDDEPAVLAGFAHSVEALGYSCSECSDPRMAKAAIEAGESDLVFLDLLDERQVLGGAASGWIRRSANWICRGLRIWGWKSLRWTMSFRTAS